MLGGNPAGALGGEVERGPAHFAAGEDAVAGAEGGIEPAFRNIAGRGIDNFYGFDGVDRKTSQLFTQMAPGIEIPVVAVVGEALWRDLALAGGAVAACAVVDTKALAFHQRCGNGREVLGGTGPGRSAENVDTPGNVFAGSGHRLEHAGEAVAQRADVFGQNAAGVESGEQLLHAEQSVNFASREPDAGQFVAFDAAVDTVRVSLAIMNDWHIHPVA